MSRMSYLLLAGLLAVPAARAEAPADPLEAAGAQLEQAATLLGEGQLDEALELLAAVRGGPAGEAPSILIDCWLLESQVHAARQNWDETVAALLQITEKYPTAPQSPDALRLQAAARQRQGRPIEARRLYDKAIADYPDSFARLDAERGLFGLDLNEGKLAPAAERLADYLSRQPWADDGPWLLGQLGSAQLEQGKHAEAAATYERIRTDYAGTQAAYEARRGLVEAYRATERWDDALAVLDEAAAADPEMFTIAEIESLRVDVLEQKGDTAAAVARLDALAERYPATFVAAQALLRKGQMLLAADDNTGAAAACQALLDRFDSPYWRVQTLRVLMGLYHDSEQYDQAEDAAAALLELTAGTPQGAEALFQMAMSQRAAERQRAARLSLERLMQTYKGPPYAVWAEQLLAQWDAEATGR